MYLRTKDFRGQLLPNRESLLVLSQYNGHGNLVVRLSGEDKGNVYFHFSDAPKDVLIKVCTIDTFWQHMHYGGLEVLDSEVALLSLEQKRAYLELYSAALRPDILDFAEEFDNPLTRAIMKGDEKEAEKLLTPGWINTPARRKDSDYFEFPITTSVRANRIRFTKKLIAAGANVNVYGFERETPLMAAIYKETQEVLLNAGADVNLIAESGNSALHQVCWEEKDDKRCIESLLIAGANPFLKNKDGIRPVDIVAGWRDTDDSLKAKILSLMNSKRGG